MQALVIVTAGDGELPTAAVDKITAYIGLGAEESLRIMGLSPIGESNE
jgi:hypothetical protein